jgi:hypothetical protein
MTAVSWYATAKKQQPRVRKEKMMKFQLNFEGWYETEANLEEEAIEELEAFFESLPGLKDLDIWAEEQEDD